MAPTKNRSSPRPPVLILGAMDAEIEASLEAMETVRQRQWNGWCFYMGRWHGREVIVCKSGVGKVFASLITQHLLDAYQPDTVLFVGVAGAVAPLLEPGDIVLGERLVQYDMDVTALGFSIGQIPFTEYQYFPGDTRMLDIAEGTAIEEGQVYRGCIGTADQFVTDRSRVPLPVDCVDMDGAAVAQGCHLNQVPSLVIRIISDKADGTADADFTSNLPRYAHRSLKIVEHVLNASR